MPKIKCPHCGANNQDVTEKDRCWQCDAVLGAPAPPVTAEPTPPAASAPTPVQKQIEPIAPAPRPTVSTPQNRLPIVPIVIGIVLLLIVIAIVVFIMKK